MSATIVASPARRHAAKASAAIARVWAITRREVAALFDHPTGYVLLVVFVVANAFLFFRQAYLVGVASLRPMIELLPWLDLFFVPAVTMRALAEDSRSGVLEVVLTQPVTDLEVVLGKYFGSVLFLWIALACTLVVPLGLMVGAPVQWGPVAAQYIGAALLAAGLAAVGVWASSVARSQITAFILGVAVMFVLILVGLDPLIVGLPPTLGTIAARLGVLSHFENITRGVIDARDAIYFLTLIGVFVALAYGSLVRRRLARGGTTARRLTLGTGLLVASLIVIDLLGNYIGGRLDLTPGHLYTLSPATRQLAGRLDDIVTIKVFASDELPTSAGLIKREVDDLLSDLRSAGHGKIRILRFDPSKDDAARRDAQSLGVEPVQFNVVGQSELQVKQGYLGLVVQYGTGTQAIPFVNRTDDLEYQLASAIASLTRTKKPVVGIVAAAAGPQENQQNIGQLRSELAKSYDIRPVSLADSTQPAHDITTLVVVGGGDSLNAAARQRLASYFARGGSALILAGSMALSQQMPFAVPRPVAWNAVLKPFGVSVHDGMVYDLAANEVVPVRASAGVQVLERYPYFVRAQSTGGSVVNQDVSGVLLPWTSSIDTTATKGWTITPLLVSSRGTGVRTGEIPLTPAADYPRTDLAPRLLAVQVAPATNASTAARIILVGDPTFATDDFTSHAPENLAFALNAVDWLAQDQALIGIRSKDRQPPPLAYTSAATREAVKYINVIGAPFLIALAGLVHLARRRARTRMRFQPLSGPTRSIVA